MPRLQVTASNKVYITRAAAALMLATIRNGVFFGGCYVKKDGSERIFCGRRGVTQGVTGKGMKYDTALKGYITYWDRGAKGFRTLNVNTLQYFNLRGKHYAIVN